MSYSKLFGSGFTERNKDHFAAIVRVAMDDGMISEDEKAFLDRLARNLQINEHDYEQILLDYKTHPINPPHEFNQRLERLYDLARMVNLDHINGESEIVLLRKMAYGLGFSSSSVNAVVDKALDLVANEADLETFILEMKKEK
ncbi:TerB family tellurite resistance protein [Formosa sediminum]|uniref:TerB family tellurite resistance protein n=1 Tax=Formosa sediminum TaxID=2594004 RepID=A0A516GP76_9FLAO|nr:TerB family tellurite resistance protein [Formosa sediminum]QDO93327.1 TerB family tellurite resistance protein [Formosa sediminum]